MADNLATFIWRLSRNPGSVHLLEPSGSLQACYKHSFTLLYILWLFWGLLTEYELSGGPSCL